MRISSLWPKILLVFIPPAIVVPYLIPAAHGTIFVLAALSIIPLAGILGTATEHLAERTSEGLGGLLNATFGNAAELIIAIVALRAGLHDVVKASLTGSIIGNVLLVLGAAFVAGGVRFEVQKFNEIAARTQSTMLTLATIALILPAVYHHFGNHPAPMLEDHLSLAIAIVLLIAYGLSLLFSLHTHKHHLAGKKHEASSEPVWALNRALLVLAVATAFIAWLSEILVHSLTPAAQQFGMSTLFVGVVIVAIIGNAAEHSTAILVARKNRMDLSLSIAMGSSVQIALFVAPILVILSYFIAPAPMNLLFSEAEILAIALAVVVTGQVASDGNSNWLEGAMLLAVYLIMGMLFFFLPDTIGTVGVPLG
jgi:Ca2+:H+ antiporter